MASVEAIKEVSIVSIQTDQSRQEEETIDYLTPMEFQSYQSKQINPDGCSVQGESKRR